MGLQPGVNFSAHVSSVGRSSSALKTGLFSGRTVLAGAGARAGGKGKQLGTPERPARRALHRGPGSRPPRVPLSLTFGTGHRPLLPSGSVPLASVANHGHRNCQRLGASLVFPTESAARAATVRGARVDSGHCIWGRTVGWCGLGEQARHGKLLPGDGDRVRADG